MILNPGKYHCNINETLMGGLFDLKFNAHIQLRRKVAQKLSALSQINKYFIYDQKLLLVNFVIKFQFTYCSLIWMFCS